jgi:uncharacterized protein
MKLLLTSLSIALATSTLASAAPAPAEPVGVQAPSAERLALSRQFVALADLVHSPLDGLSDDMWHEASANIPDKAARAEARQRVQQMLAELRPKVSKRLPGISEAYASAYAREFAADELRDLIAFARTPAGKHYIAEAGTVEIDDEVVAAEMEMWEDVEPVFEEMNRVLCAEKTAQRIAAGEVKAKCPLSQPDTAQG